MKDAESEHEPPGRLLLALLDSVQQVLDALRALSLQLRERQFVQIIEVGRIAHELRIHELRHDLLAEAADVHRAAMREMFDAPFHLLRTVGIGAADGDLTLVLHDIRAAHRTMCRHRDALLTAGALFLVHADDGRNDLAGLFDGDEVADPDVLALDLLEVVQRGVAHGAAAEEDGLEPRDGRERAGAADLDVHREQSRLGLLRLVFVGDGPARGLARRAEIALFGERVHLDDRAVGFVGKLPPFLVEFADGPEDLLIGVAMPDEIGLRQSGVLEQRDDVAL